MKQDRFVGNFVFDLSKWTTRYIFFLKILKSDGYGQLKLNKKKKKKFFCFEIMLKVELFLSLTQFLLRFKM